MSYGIFALIITVVWGGILAFMIATDLHGKKGDNQSVAEVIDTSNIMKPDEESTYVEEQEVPKEELPTDGETKETAPPSMTTEFQQEETSMQEQHPPVEVENPEETESEYQRLKEEQSKGTVVQQDYQFTIKSEEALSLFESRKYKKTPIIEYSNIS